MKRGLLVILIFILIIGAIATYGIMESHDQDMEREEDIRVPVQVERASFRLMERKIELTGDVLPLEKVFITPKVGGVILEKLLVDKGSLVKKGQPLAFLEHETIDAQLNQVEAELNVAKAQLKKAEVNLSNLSIERIRYEKLYEKGVVPKQTLDNVDTQYRSLQAEKELAKAQIKKMEAMLRQLRIQKKDHTIFAPTDGIIAEKFLDEGNLVDRKNPILLLLKMNPIKVLTKVVEEEIPYLSQGKKVEIRLDPYPGRVFRGRIVKIDPMLDSVTRTAGVEIHIPNDEYLLRPGMFAKVRIILDRKKALAIPSDALQRYPGTGVYFVYTVDGDFARKRNIKLGLREGNTVEVIEGLKEGDRVVVRGQENLRTGTPVRIVREGGIG